MNKDDILNLAGLARLDLTDEEIATYGKNIPEILSYVGKLNDVKTDESGRIESAGIRNVFREDGEPHETGLHTDDILNGAPDIMDGFVKVKKILNN